MVPEAFCHLVGSLDIPQPLAEQWWRALLRAKWSTSVSFRQVCTLPHSHPPTFYRQVLTPCKIIGCLEALVGEGYLTRRCANQLMEYVLVCSTEAPAALDWRGVELPHGSRWDER